MSMKTPLVNIFVYGYETHVHAIGWRVYERAGSHRELTGFLQSTVHHDHQGALSANTRESLADGPRSPHRVTGEPSNS